MRSISECENRFHYSALAAMGSCLPKLRGLRTVTKTLGGVFGDNKVVVEHELNFRFCVYLDDPYWTGILFSSEYEPEVLSVLDRRLDENTVFIDCGANIGYWSCFAATRTKQLTAIEAAQATYDKLLENSHLNGSFNTVRYAVSNQSGDSVDFIYQADRHGAAHIVQKTNGHSEEDTLTAGITETVETIALDDLSDASEVVIKLDVEGAEVDAVLGAKRLIERGAILIYEDHGNDPDCLVTRQLMDLGLTIEDTNEEPLSLDRLQSMKKLPYRGYNFIAHA